MQRILERLTDVQKSQYKKEGYLLVPGLVPEDTLSRAETAMRELIRNNTEPLIESKYHRLLQIPAEVPDLIGIFEPQFIAVAAQLTGDDPITFPIPRQPWALIVCPYGSKWQWPDPHVDHALKEDNFKIFPPPFRIASITYLSDVPPHGGGTIVWPRSHKTLAAFVKTHRKSYRYMSDLNLNLDQVSLEHPVELIPSRGDVLFYHYLCAHSAGMNVSKTPRLALGKKW